MLLRFVIMASVLAIASADCDACVEGVCYSKKVLIQGFHITDQMAIDRLHHVLYVQMNSNMNTAFFIDDLKIQLLQTLSTTGMTVDQDTQVLYTADPQKVLYKYKLDSNETEEDSAVVHEEAEMLLFHKNVLYYTTKCCKGIYFIENGTSMTFTFTKEYLVTDFVIDKDDKIYFVANDTIYMLNKHNTIPPAKVIEKNYVLSTDKNGAIYFGDSTENIIYKINNETNEILQYAAYQTGSVDKFIFDNSNNIVFHDSAAKSVSLWKSENTKCSIEPPHAKYLINMVQESSCPEDLSANMV